MILTLEVTGPQAGKLGNESSKVFRNAGGSIGRLTDNDWVLPDPYVSSRHAYVRYTNGAFFIEDASTNGVFINSPENRLTRGKPHPLSSGDWIFIEPYEIRVSIAADAAVSAADEIFGTISDAAPVIANPFEHDSFEKDPFLPAVDPTPSGEVDPMVALFSDRPASRDPVPPVNQIANIPVEREHFRPPVATAPPGAPGPLIPENWETDSSRVVVPSGDRSPLVDAPGPGRPQDSAISGPRPQPGPRRPQPSHRPESPSSPVRPGAGRDAPRVHAKDTSTAGAQPSRAGDAGAGLAQILAGAGIDNVVVTPELARDFGRILRIVVAGVMDVLQARQRIKDEFRMGMTTFKPAANNPLKFSANVDDALHNLLIKRNTAYLGPVEAFEDAFDDIRNHQVAMLAGVRVAFDALLRELHPDSLQDEFDRQLKKGALVSMPGKLRYWDLYREKIRDMVSDADATFRTLFGQEFADAYEAQLKRLKAQGRSGQS